MPDTVDHPYIMEHCEEAERLKRKTRRERVTEQAYWAGLRPGMRVLDAGCGSGITTAIFEELVSPAGRAIGIDGSPERVAWAQSSYPHIEFTVRDFYENLEDLGRFDFIWIRFVLEYHRRNAGEIIRRLSQLLTPEGILCAGDLDYNCLNHFPMDPELEAALKGLVAYLEREADWDPFAGRKLYTYFYDLGFRDIDLRIDAHHLMPGAMNSDDEYNWISKLKVAVKNSGYPFPELEGGFDEFLARSQRLFADPRRFTYTPLIIARGVRPTAGSDPVRA